MNTVKRIKTGDTVKIISGSQKGTEAKVTKVMPREGKALLENIGLRTRHIRANQFNTKGGKKEIHVGIDLSKLALVKRAEIQQPKKSKSPQVAKKSDPKEQK